MTQVGVTLRSLREQNTVHRYHGTPSAKLGGGGTVGVSLSGYSTPIPGRAAHDAQTQLSGAPSAYWALHFHHSLDGIFHRGYICHMKWEVEYTDAFGHWWSGLSEEE